MGNGVGLFVGLRVGLLVGAVVGDRVVQHSPRVLHEFDGISFGKSPEAKQEQQPGHCFRGKIIAKVSKSCRMNLCGSAFAHWTYIA